MTSYVVQSGQTSSSITLNAGDSLLVSSGGAATAITVGAQSFEAVSAGGVTSATTISSGGALIILPGAAAANTVVSPGGTAISSGVVVLNATSLVETTSGTLPGADIFNGETELVLPGGTSLDSPLLGGTELVYSGGIASSTGLAAGSVESIFLGGMASATLVSSGGAENVFAGGVATGTVVSSGGDENVFAGGLASGSVVAPGATEAVSGGTLISATVSGTVTLTAGATATGTVITVSGTQLVSSGATAIATDLSAGGKAFIYAGGTASGFVVSGGSSELVVLSGGTAASTLVASGGVALVSAAAMASGAVVSSGGILVALPGAITSAVVTEPGGADIISGAVVLAGFNVISAAGQTLNGAVVAAGEQEIVQPGGTAVASLLSSGGAEYVYSGGTAEEITINSGATAIVQSGGTAAFVTIHSGGTELVNAEGTASGTILYPGGTQSVSMGGTVVGTTLEAGVAQFVNSGFTVSDTVLLSGADEYVSSGGFADATLVSSGGLEFVYSGATASGSVVDSGGILVALPGAIATNVATELGGLSVISGAVVISNNSLIAAASQILSGAVVGPGEQEIVESGGSTLGSIMSGGGGAEYVYSGAIADSTTINAGGTVTVLSGGVASSVTVSYGGTEIVDADGVASNTILLSGGQIVSAGGTFDGFTLAGGAVQNVVSGSNVSGTVLASGGVQNVTSGATAYDTVVSSGGSVFVYSGGTVSGATVDSGGALVTLPGAIVSNLNVESGGSMLFPKVLVIGSGGYVQSAGETLSDAIVGTGETESILSGGTAVKSFLEGGYISSTDGYKYESSEIGALGGDAIVSSGGTALDTTVGLFSDGTIEIGGVAVGNVVFAGGSESVYSGGTASGTVLTAGEISYGTTEIGGFYVNSLTTVVAVQNVGGTAVGTVVNADAQQYVDVGGVASGTVVSAGGLQEVSQEGGVATNTVLDPGGGIFVTDLPYAGGSANFNSTTGVITVTEGSDTYVETLSGNYTGAQFYASAVKQGTLISNGVFTGLTPCYCRGTLILTPAGEIPVEDLRIGDRVVTRSVFARPIRWIGRRSYAGRFAAGNPDVLPVLIRAGALDTGVPRRDLMVSPLHAMYLDDVLIPAAALVNGVSIIQLDAVEQVDYFHIELDSHDIIVAEGALSETFVDDNSRFMFHNADEFHLLYPDTARVPARYCAPRVEDGDDLEAVRSRLAALTRSTPSVPVQAGTLLGFIDEVGHDSIRGWAYDKTDPETPVRLRILDNDSVLGDVVADVYRGDLAAAGIGNACHGFGFIVPSGLSPLTHHDIQVQRLSDGRDLANSPLRLAPQPDAPAQWRPIAIQLPATPENTSRGRVDTATRERISGWAVDGADPAAPMAVQILDNGVPIARVLANLYRADLEQAGIGRGRHGFDVTFPGGLSPLVCHIIQVKRARDGVDLPGSPVVIDAAGRFDTGLAQAVESAVAAVAAPDEGERVLSFMMAQADRLIQRHADAEAKRDQRRAAQRARRRRGPAPERIAPKQLLRALVVDMRLPDPTRDAGSQAILSHMRALQRLGYAVSFVAAGDMARPAPDSALAAAGITCCGAPFYASVEEILRRQSECFDVIYLHRADMAARYLALARAYAPRARILFSVADLQHIRLQRQAAIEDRPELLAASRHLQFIECTAACSADAVITHSTAEADILRHLVPAARVHCVTWDLPIRRSPPPFAKRHGVAFIGSYDHAPNRDAAHWLVECVMPLVWQIDPAVTCLLGGSNMPDTLRRLARPGIVPVGHVSDLAGEVLDRVRLTVAPLRFGAGLKGKVLESFAAGVPCVMSEVAAEGLAWPPALQALIGRDAQALAALINPLHTDQAVHRAASHAGRTLIRDKFGENLITAALHGAIEGQTSPAQIHKEQTERRTA